MDESPEMEVAYYWIADFLNCTLMLIYLKHAQAS